MVVALNGMQGSGKSTLGRLLKWAYGLLGVAFEVASLDDFYLTYAERTQLDPTLYRYRGPPGTHSMAELLQVLRDFRAGADSLRLPVFNKALHGGAGDREGYREVKCPQVEKTHTTRRYCCWRVGCRGTGKWTRRL